MIFGHATVSSVHCSSPCAHKHREHQESKWQMKYSDKPPSVFSKLPPKTGIPSAVLLSKLHLKLEIPSVVL